MQLTIRDADLADAAQGEALVRILDAYAREPGGQGQPLSAAAREGLVAGLREQAVGFALLAWHGEQALGAAVCQWGYSTFAARPSLNLHDLAVLPEHRGRGIGTQLLRAVEQRARERGCCKLTLEVHESNQGARRLYEREGFGPWRPATLFVSKALS